MVTKGDVLELKEARVLSVKDDYDHYNGYPRWYRKVMLQDPKFGKVWFKTSAKFSEEVFRDCTIDCSVTVSGLGTGIIFAKSPKEAIIKSEYL
jgi:hypothetical protein